MLSFGKMQKKEISDHLPKSVCCKRAVLFGALTGRGMQTADGILLQTDAESAAFFARVLDDLSVRDTVILPTVGGGRGLTLRFSCPAAQRFLDEQMGRENFFFQPKCSSCRQHLLRGLFLSCGRISDPRKEYCLEFSCKNNENQTDMLLQTFGFAFRRTIRKSETLLVCKNSVGVEDFLSAAGLNSAVFDVMNAKIESEFLVSANRIANCETNNIKRSVRASKIQIEAAEYLQKRQALSSLSPELEEAARLRLENSEMSIHQLALRCIPPISKSGFSHRLDKIVAVADKMRKTENQVKSEGDQS